MSQEAITCVDVKNFGPLGKIQLSFSPSLNIIVGENNTGKSQLLRLLYSTVSVLQEVSVELKTNGNVITKDYCDSAIGYKLQRVLRPQDNKLGRLAKRVQGGSRAEVAVDFAGNVGRLSFNFSTRAKDKVVTDEHPRQSLSDMPVFLPSHEIISIASEIVGISSTFNHQFDDVWVDTAKLLMRPTVLGRPTPPFVELMQSINENVIGDVRSDGANGFYVAVPGEGNFESTVVSEGLRKFAMLARLIDNGMLLEGGYLFWDEPEANLNPKAIRDVAMLIVRLANQGTQVFVATHSLFLLRELAIAQSENKIKEPASYIRLGRQADHSVSGQVYDSLDDIETLASLDAELEQMDRYVQSEFTDDQRA